MESVLMLVGAAPTEETVATVVEAYCMVVARYALEDLIAGDRAKALERLRSYSLPVDFVADLDDACSELSQLCRQVYLESVEGREHKQCSS